MLFKMRKDKKPVYFYDKISTAFGYSTRLATTHGIRCNTMISTELTKNSFLNRTTETWNKLPVEIRSITTIREFKKKIKIWVKDSTNIT